jgi:hypothetical protein
LVKFEAIIIQNGINGALKFNQIQIPNSKFIPILHVYIRVEFHQKLLLMTSKFKKIWVGIKSSSNIKSFLHF